MIVFPSMLVGAAVEADIPVPPDPDNFDSKRYPHFAIFCAVQLCRRMEPGEHWHNAEVIAQFRKSEIIKVTFADLIKAGLKI